jgi:hypothetical protein
MSEKEMKELNKRMYQKLLDNNVKPKCNKKEVSKRSEIKKNFTEVKFYFN